MHIAIIGAGISGLLSALELAEQGCHVHIFDQQHAGQAASWAGGGILSPMYPWRYPQAVNHLAEQGKRRYQHWNERLMPHTGIDFEIHETGMLIFDEDDFEIGQNYQRLSQDPMQHCDYLQHTKLQQINPRVAPQFKHALYFSQLANIRNPRLLKSLTHYLKHHPKVKFAENTWIDRFDIAHQQIQSLRTQSGQKITAEHYLITTGAWSHHWAEQLQLHIPVQPVQGQMLLFKTPEHWLPSMCMNQVMYLIPRRDGHVVCGSSMDHIGFDHRPTVSVQQNIFNASIEMVPELAQFPIVKQWAGLRPSSPTGIPYIGKMPHLKNLWANFGHYRNGLCMGPTSAQLLRNLILQQAPVLDPTPYSTARLQMI